MPTGVEDGGARGAPGRETGLEGTRGRIVPHPTRLSIDSNRYSADRGPGKGSIAGGLTCTAGCASRSIRLSRFLLSERSVENARGGSGLCAARVTTRPRMPRRLLESTMTAARRRATPAGPDATWDPLPNMRVERGWLDRTRVEAGMVCMAKTARRRRLGYGVGDFLRVEPSFESAVSQYAIQRTLRTWSRLRYGAESGSRRGITKQQRRPKNAKRKRFDPLVHVAESVVSLIGRAGARSVRTAEIWNFRISSSARLCVFSDDGGSSWALMKTKSFLQNKIQPFLQID